MRSACGITLHGCDDSTRLSDVELDAQELSTLRRIEALVTAADAGGCKPSLTVTEAPAHPEDALCTECWEHIPTDAPRARDGYGEWVHGPCPADGATA